VGEDETDRGISNEDEDPPNPNGLLDNEAAEGSGGDAGPIPTKKRKRGLGTAAFNKAIQTRRLNRLTEAWADEEERLDDTKAVLEEKQRSYAQFFKPYPHLGVVRVARMIKAMEAVTTKNLCTDWRPVMRFWRRRQEQNKSLYDNATQYSVMVDNESWPASNELEEDNRLRNLYFSSERCGDTSILEAFRRRWYLAELFRTSESIKKRLACSQPRSGQVGVGVASLARQQQFRTIHRLPQHEQVNAKDERWVEFDRMLNRGKQWNFLCDAFGEGIFAVLPPSEVSNSFIERTLRVDDLMVFGRLLVERVPNLQRLCDGFRPIFAALIEGADAPEPMMRLEVEQAWDMLPPESRTTLALLDSL
jgi:hypothetical protein